MRKIGKIKFTKKFLKQNVEDLIIADQGLRIRILICLLQANIKTVSDLLEHKNDLYKLPNIGLSSIKAIKTALKYSGYDINFKNKNNLKKIGKYKRKNHS